MNRKSKQRLAEIAERNPERFQDWAKMKNEIYSVAREKRRKEMGFPDKIGRSILPDYVTLLLSKETKE